MKVSVGGIGRTGSGELLVGDQGLATAMSYCHSQGLFAGISFDGSVILPRYNLNNLSFSYLYLYYFYFYIFMIIYRNEVNLNFYGRQVTPYQLLSGEIPPPNAAKKLYSQLQKSVELCDKYYGVTSRERSHQDMLTKLQLQQQQKEGMGISNTSMRRGGMSDVESKENNDENDLLRGVGDQYY